MLKLIRRKSFRKSRDLNSEESRPRAAVNSAGGGQYSVREGRSSSRLHSTISLADNSLDRQLGKTRSRYSSLANNVSDQPPEIIQYSRPPERRLSNGVLTDSTPATTNINPSPGCETTVQKLFFDSVLNGQTPAAGGAVRKSCENVKRVKSVEKSELSPTTSVIVREISSPVVQDQSHPYIRRSSVSRTSNINNNNNKPDTQQQQQQNVDDDRKKTGRRSVMTVLRQSFRKSKKDRPTVASRTSSANPEQVSQRRTSSESQSRISVASVRTSRTPTASRASIVSRTSCDRVFSEQSEISGQESRVDQSSASDKCSDNMKTVSNHPVQQSSALVRSVKPVPSSSSRTEASSTTPAATPRQSGQRFLPETPKLINGGSGAAAVPPIYANVHQQLNPGNNRQQMNPGIAKILEDSGNKRQENGVHRSPSVTQSVSRSSSSSQFPPSIPKPAARMSLRQKVGLDSLCHL